MLRPPAAGPANFTVPLKKAGMYYFGDPVTTIGQRNCDAGMLIAVSVGGVCRRPPPPPGEHDMQDHAPTDVHDAWETAAVSSGWYTKHRPQKLCSAMPLRNPNDFDLLTAAPPRRQIAVALEAASAAVSPAGANRSMPTPAPTDQGAALSASAMPLALIVASITAAMLI